MSHTAESQMCNPVTTSTPDLMVKARHLAFECTAELLNARDKWSKFNSAHEAYAVLAEEVDELWEHVRTNQKRRDVDAMRKECIQVAAMAMRFALEICNEVDGRK